MRKSAKSSKQRVDQLLVERELAENRTRAQALIMAGLVFNGKRKLEKPGQIVAIDADLEVRERNHPWVSRGGLKLAHALKVFELDPKESIAIDVGASTGGFTDVLLENGAGRVYAVDVGHGQLAWKLRRDNRVVVLERTNARYLTRELIVEPPNWIVCDASFIALATVLPSVMGLALPTSQLVALIKPQFEAGRDLVGKGGVVRDPSVHKAICDRVGNWLKFTGWTVQGIERSPITGPQGNVEFLIAATKRG